MHLCKLFDCNQYKLWFYFTQKWNSRVCDGGLKVVHFSLNSWKKYLDVVEFNLNFHFSASEYYFAEYIYSEFPVYCKLNLMFFYPD